MVVPSENRVFHIDRECYIIYLGSDPDDYKPFLRIGNSKNLPEIIKENIYYIVITDSLTGNPLLEPENMNKDDHHENKYVGDKKSLSEFFKFLNCFNIKTEGYPITDKLQANENKAVISYFDNGNLTLQYNKKLIFDLKRREAEDLHYIELAKRIKNQIKLDPLFLGYDFFKSINYGFICMDNSIIHINKGQFFADELPDDYFETLIYNRLDPDLISTLIKSEADENLIHILKRKLTLNEKLDIIPKNKDKILSCTVNLFNLKNNLFAIKNRISTNEVSIKVNNNQTIVENNKIKMISITIKERRPLLESKSKESMREKILYIDQYSKEILYNIDQEIFHQPLIGNIPYIINNDPEIDILKLESDIDETISFFKDSINSQETTILNTLKSLLKSNIKEESLIESYLKSSERQTRHPRFSILTSLIALSIINVIKYTVSKRNILSYLERIIKIENKLKNHISQLKRSETYLPLIAKIYINTPIVIFSLTKSNANPGEYQYSIDNEKEIKSTAVINYNLFGDNTRKLTQLIENLTKKRSISIGKYSPESREVKKDIGQKKIKEVEVEKISNDLKNEENPEPMQKQKAKIETVVGHTLKKRKSPKRKSILILIPIIIAIIAGGLYFITNSQLITARHKKNVTVISQTKQEKQTLSENLKNSHIISKSASKEEKVIAKSEGKMASEQTLKKEGLSKKEIETFLDLGYIKITILDVYRLTNRIAKTNGYRTLDNLNELGKDPNWIYPGNKLKLPDNSVYTVIKGDTIWYIAKRFIKKELDKDWKLYQQIKKKIQVNNINIETKKNIIDNLIKMRNRTYSENFKKLLEEIINNLRK